jgi:hypothetical protein
MRERGVGSGGVCSCSFGEPLKTTRKLSNHFIYSNMCLKIISFCSFENVGLLQVKDKLSQVRQIKSGQRQIKSGCL